MSLGQKFKALADAGADLAHTAVGSAVKAVGDLIPDSRWRPIEMAPDEVKELVPQEDDIIFLNGIQYEAVVRGDPRIRLVYSNAHGTFAFGVGADGKVHDYFIIPEPPQHPKEG